MCRRSPAKRCACRASSPGGGSSLTRRQGAGDQTSRYIASTSARPTRWLWALAEVKIGFFTPPKKRSRRASLDSKAGSKSSRR